MSLLDTEDELIEKIDLRMEFELTMRKTLYEIVNDISKFEEFCVIEDKTKNTDYDSSHI